MQMYKKQGLCQSQNQLICLQKLTFSHGIPQNLITKSKIQLEHLQCYICHNIIWKAIACSQSSCFASCCQYCISNYDGELVQDFKKCPKCGKKFQKTTIPLLNNLLSQILLKCPYSANCQKNIPYDIYLKHCINCDYRKIQCQGCHQLYCRKQIKQHQDICSYIIINCQKCSMKLPQIKYRQQHSQIKCLQRQLQKKTNILGGLENQIVNLKDRLQLYQNMIGKIIKGQSLSLKIQFYTSFPTNFQFGQNQIKINRPSWNTIKQKYDFLHFYITNPIKTQAPISFQWRLQVITLQGNLLIGICSSLSINSVDFVINRFGQIKKKQSNQNKYKLIRKSNLTFIEGDIINFKYLALRKILKIQNQTKNVQCKLQAKQINQLGQNLYSFYSLDTINDTIKFLQY